MMAGWWLAQHSLPIASHKYTSFIQIAKQCAEMSTSNGLKQALVALLFLLAFIISTSNVEARYLPTRSDPLQPVGPPRGEDPRFDRLYDIIKELLKNVGDPYEEMKYEPKGRYEPPGRF